MNFLILVICISILKQLENIIGNNIDYEVDLFENIVRKCFIINNNKICI